MATLTVQNPSLAGVVPTVVTCAAGGDKFAAPAGGKPVILRIRNAHATNPRTVTIDDPNSQGPASAKAFNPDVDITIAALTTKYVRIDYPQRFVNAADSNLIALSYSDSAADLTLEIIQGL